MTSLALSGRALSLCIIVGTSLTGCGGPQPPTGAPSTMPQSLKNYQRATESVIHNFAGPPDGYEPAAGLLNVGDTLYGTTSYGGDHDDGMVFQIRHGAESVLYNFTAQPDGYAPEAGLIDIDGTLYGTTLFGGTRKCHGYQGSCGTVYSVSAAGSEKVLYRFKGGSDGLNPAGGLTRIGRKMYGTTQFGGYGYNGTVYGITQSGAEKIVHRFNGADGQWPMGSTFAEVHGKLYGTVRAGGAYGFGAVFTMTQSGTEKVLYSFGGRSFGGQYPNGTLIDLGGTLYGTTAWGGAHGVGTVYKVTTNGTETVLHSFSEPKDGGEPLGGLIDINGTLYGTTCGTQYNDHGTFFNITKSGTETVLYRFNGLDGDCPVGNLIYVSGTFYGVTFIGGTSGSGTVYSLAL